jgi:hypothetical protein
MNNQSFRSWRFHVLFILASRCSTQLGSISNFQVLREVNHIADNLVKQRVNKIYEFQAWI